MNLKPTNTLNCKTGTENVPFEFTKYYKGVVQPHNANKDVNIASEVDLLMTADNIMINYVGCHVTIEDVDKCISKMKLHKAAYLDNITSEHLRYGGPHLAVHLCLLFNFMMHYCFVPSKFCKDIILQLLKNKHGDATDINVYRGITLSPVMSKLFEAVLLHLYNKFLSSDSLQFGFKKNSSCTHAMFTVNEMVKYFTKKGYKVYCAFLDATKAFDSVA